MIETAEQLAEEIGVKCACRVLGVARSSLYRIRQEKMTESIPSPEPSLSPRALHPDEKATVRDVLNSPRFQDQAPREVYATLLDEGQYLCSWRTMYRILDEHQEVRERRDQLRHPQYTKPELLATGPNQLWSWDITKLLGTNQVDLLLSLQHPGCLQPLLRRLDDRRTRIRQPGRGADRRHLCPPKHSTGTAHHPCRSRQLDDLQTGGAADGRFGRDENPLPPARLQ